MGRFVDFQNYNQPFTKKRKGAISVKVFEDGKLLGVFPSFNAARQKFALSRLSSTQLESIRKGNLITSLDYEICLSSVPYAKAKAASDAKTLNLVSARLKKLKAENKRYLLNQIVVLNSDLTIELVTDYTIWELAAKYGIKEGTIKSQLSKYPSCAKNIWNPAKKKATNHTSGKYFVYLKHLI